MKPDWSSLSRTEDTIIQLIESNAQGFSQSLFNIELSPVYRSLNENFWHAPDAHEFWHKLFVEAAIISRRLRLSSAKCVTILGESGTGKELFARAFGVGRTFVPINCTSLPDQLLESELYGHVAGSFTGAIRDKPGLLVEAGNGVAFLDEVSSLPEHLQCKLLRALQDRTVRPVGATKEVPIYCTIVCASNADLRKSLRLDLYWRLTSFVLTIPSWRDRVNEIDWMIRCRLDEAQLLSAEDRAQIVEAMHQSTGNFRELVALVDRIKLRVWLARCTKS